jgi:pseudaminic acid synthase
MSFLCGVPVSHNSASLAKNFNISTPRGPRLIGEGAPCFIVAEVSANHEQDLEKARELVRLAARSGADALKLQTYLPSTMTLPSDKEVFLVKGETTPGEWKNQTLYDIYSKAYTPWEWHQELQALTESLGMVFFSTPFDATAVDFLETQNVPLYKIASYEMTDLPLLKKVARTGKPVIMSVGFADLPEIELSLKTLQDHGARDIVLLYCATNYSHSPSNENCHLQTIRDLRKRFSVITGFSDNTGGVEVPYQAALMGATIIEKHIVLSSQSKALDASFSINEQELAAMVKAIRQAEQRVGEPFYGTRNETESYFRRFRRSIFVSKKILKGEILSEQNVKIIRPADGIAPKHWDEVLGQRAKSDLEPGTPLSWEMIGLKGASNE